MDGELTDHREEALDEAGEGTLLKALFGKPFAGPPGTADPRMSHVDQSRRRRRSKALLKHRTLCGRTLAIRS